MSDAVYVCPIKDIECGDHKVGWCNMCPKHGNQAHAPAPVPLTAIQILGGLMDAGVPDKFFHAFTAGARFAERKHGIAVSPEKP